ncbi:MAG: serine/threonine protein kinase [Planctomycetes bacterium]|nr:serine/threonine protein kinase [Planctomycetota bacterium]
MHPEHLGPYRIARLLGRGGMGAVFEGVHGDTGERVAVKVLSASLADEPSFRARFAAEIETLKTLHHPNIVRLIGYGEQDGQLFYAMELIDGNNLHDLLRQGRRFGWREVAEFAVQVSLALKHAHDHGVIHRDLKPANLLLASDGTIRLTDFGIAKLFGATHLTAAGGIIGTIDYMAPEQADGEPVTPRSDLYSLGGVMYALLLGRPPFTGRTAIEVLSRMRAGPPDPIRRFQAEVPEELDDIILQLLDRDPQKRVATPIVLAKRLRATLHALNEDRLARSTAIDENGELDEGASPSGTGSDSAVARAGRSEPDDESPTPKKASTGSYDVATREISSSRLHDIPWDEETIGGDAVPSSARETPEPSTQFGTRGGTVAQTRFTSIEEEHAKSGREPDAASRGARGASWMQTASFAGLAVGLVALIAVAWTATRPPSADRLFARIQEGVLAAETGDYQAVRREMDEFLERFAEDPRAGRVQGHRDDHDAHRLWRRLEREARKAGGAEYLPDVERTFMTAMREEGVRPQRAAELFRDLARFRAEPMSDRQRECVDVAARRAARRPAASAPDGAGEGESEQPVPPSESASGDQP